MISLQMNRAVQGLAAAVPNPDDRYASSIVEPIPLVSLRPKGGHHSPSEEAGDVSAGASPGCRPYVRGPHPHDFRGTERWVRQAGPWMVRPAP